MYGAKTQAQKCTGQVTMWFDIKLKNGADKANGGGERYVMAPVADQLMQHKCCD